jgi:2-keto-4-pentenoate hydratase/2-oxohepta-3-ene-1,7-dioic acid hydratase in catechol pathway
MGRTKLEHPVLFARFPTSQVGTASRSCDRARPNASLALVIGKAGRQIPENRALEHVPGYACYNDGSVRDWNAILTSSCQERTSRARARSARRW